MPIIYTDFITKSSDIITPLTLTDVVVMSSTSGVVEKSYSYDAFGVENDIDDEDVNPFRYCGEYYDNETNTYYLRARNYDPAIGRFLSEDTYRGSSNDPLSLNLYTYCYNNPIRYIDNTGNAPQDVTRALVKWLLSNTDAVYYTQNPDTEFSTWFGTFTVRDVFYAAGFVVDSYGRYHARQDCLQGSYGYNNFYDTVFDYASHMRNVNFQFTSGGREYILWAWKGDYLNMGAGAELGIYTRGTDKYTDLTTTIGYSPEKDHWVVDTSLAMHMTLTLIYDGEIIIIWDPAKDKNFDNEKVWWVTGFSPYKQDIDVNLLTAIFTITFNDELMYNDFYDKFGDKNSKYYDSRWLFDSDTITAKFIF